MSTETVKATIGHGESAVIEPKGFRPGKHPVTVSLSDEPGDRKLVVHAGGQRIVADLPEPAAAPSR